VAVDVVAIDMPIATSPITTRREADAKVSKAFARAKCSTHSPAKDRPGELSDELSRDFASLGYDIAKVGMGGSSGRIFETYPHPALLSLVDEQERLKYKLSRTQKYWPESPPAERRIMLVREWSRILARLKDVISGITLGIPCEDSVGSIPLKELKGVEDALDALVCAWVATQFLSGNCDAYGDDTAAIWIPKRPGSWERL
jgi:predicted RNase H-like nuclease